jgi:hypothetical protein
MFFDTAPSDIGALAGPLVGVFVVVLGFCALIFVARIIIAGLIKE